MPELVIGWLRRFGFFAGVIAAALVTFAGERSHLVAWHVAIASVSGIVVMFVVNVGARHAIPGSFNEYGLPQFGGEELVSKNRLALLIVRLSEATGFLLNGSLIASTLLAAFLNWCRTCGS